MFKTALLTTLTDRARRWPAIPTPRRANGAATVVVTNTGTVIPPYDIPGIVEPFRRLGADRLAPPPGAGLGLPIVRAVARAHGGEVEARPRDVGGLTVTVTLPGVHVLSGDEVAADNGK
ncbi:sensor histidine kinase [Saccharomonospora sp. NPDC046836]|uniref:sensor histidine kinase n=1 Tax=Saccharomonospora sp. NPDC046836 TaxID=3156921 RepID=UPI00340A2578